MGIFETLAKPYTQAALGTSLGAMEGMVAHKATTSGKEQVGIVFVQSGKSVKSDAIDFYKNGGREARLVEEFDPVRVVVIKHGALYYFTIPRPPCFYMTDSVAEESLWRCRSKEGEKTNVGFIKTIGEDAERPVIGSNQIRGILSLHKPFQE
jgi:hypothetical protein